MRFRQADVLDILGNKYKVSTWTEASTLLRQSGEKTKKTCEHALKQNKQGVPNSLLEIADTEEEACRLLNVD